MFTASRFPFSQSKSAALFCRRHVLFFGLIFISFVSYAQTGNISGKVTDKAGKPLAFASVIIDTLKTGTNSDEQGNYRLENVPAGIYVVTVSITGYEKQTQHGYHTYN